MNLNIYHLLPGSLKCQILHFLAITAKVRERIGEISESVFNQLIGPSHVLDSSVSKPDRFKSDCG